MARQSFHQRAEERPANERTRPRVERPAPEIPEFDPLVHERMRLGIISALATNESLSFHDLKRLLDQNADDPIDDGQALLSALS